VIEGRVGEVRFEGTRRYTPEQLRGRLATLVPGKLITSGGMEQDLLLLNDLPGLTARAVLEAGKEFGTTDVTINVDERAVSAYFWPNKQLPPAAAQGRAPRGQKTLIFLSASIWESRMLAMARRSTRSSRNAPWKWWRHRSEALARVSARISITAISDSATTLAERWNFCLPR